MNKIVTKVQDRFRAAMNSTGFRKAALLAVVFLAGTALSAQTAETLASNLQTEGQAWIYWVMRIIGGFMALGGLWALIKGMDDSAEGLGKATKVGGGLLLMLIGVYILANTASLYTTLNLAKLFSAT